MTGDLVKEMSTSMSPSEGMLAVGKQSYCLSGQRHAEEEGRNPRSKLTNERGPRGPTPTGAAVETCAKANLKRALQICQPLYQLQGQQLAWMEAFPTPGETTDMVAQVLLEHIIPPFGIPSPQAPGTSALEPLLQAQRGLVDTRGQPVAKSEIINLDVNFHMEGNKTQGHPKVHTFSTFFYTKLKSGGYSSVKRWTQEVNLFEKKLFWFSTYRCALEPDSNGPLKNEYYIPCFI
ncbi:hypothetical protein A6R68_14247, partial [Neotoma lepida]